MKKITELTTANYIGFLRELTDLGRKPARAPIRQLFVTREYTARIRKNPVTQN